MALKGLIQQMGTEDSMSFVPIALNNRRAFPDNEKDKNLLKNLLNKLEDRVVQKFGKKTTIELLNKIARGQNRIDVIPNLDSLYILLSNNVKEIIMLPQVTHKNFVQISNTLAFISLSKGYSRSTPYFMMIFSKEGDNISNNHKK